MAENGNNWIKLNRSITDHWLWSSGETFSRGQAFIDLLLMAAYADHPIVSQGKRMNLKRGSMVTSIRYLADRWRWSKDKTMNFLNDLEADGTIEKVSDTKRTVLTIVNYEKYQGSATNDRTQNGRKTDTDRTQNGQTKESKEGKRNISNIFVPPTVDEVKAYCDENGYSVNSGQFVDFYESKGWMVGKTKMKNWKAAVRTWQRNSKADTGKNKNSFMNFTPRKYDMEQLEKDLLRADSGEEDESK